MCYFQKVLCDFVVFLYLFEPDQILFESNNTAIFSDVQKYQPEHARIISDRTVLIYGHRYQNKPRKSMYQSGIQHLLQLFYKPPRLHQF